MDDLQLLMNTAQRAAVEAGKAIMDIYWSGEFFTQVKKDETPLTIADRNSHEIITRILAQTNLPVLSEEGISIPYKERKKWNYFWLIDPLDGTKEFINKIGEFTVNIALMNINIAVGGVIYIPLTDVLYYGSQRIGVYKNDKGKLFQFQPLEKRVKFDTLVRKDHLTIVASRSHLSHETKDYIRQFKNVTLISSGSSLKFMLLLENSADIYPRLGKTMEWDTAAAHAILNASNRGVYQTDLRSEITYNKEDLANPFFIAF